MIRQSAELSTYIISVERIDEYCKVPVEVTQSVSSSILYVIIIAQLHARRLVICCSGGTLKYT